jgi:hypothetical protein
LRDTNDEIIDTNMFFYKLICRCVGLYNIIPNRLFAAEAKSLLNMSAQ